MARVAEISPPDAPSRPQRLPEPTPRLVGLGLVVLFVVAAGAARLAPDPATLYLELVGLGAALGLGALAWRVDPAWALSAGIVATIFSGNWDQLGFPIGADRILLVTGILGTLLRARRSGTESLRFEPVYVALAAVAVWAICSSFLAGTITQPQAFYGLLDRLGIVPFGVFAIAPLALRTERQRGILLVALVATGGYLSAVALFETTGLRDFIFPRYINNEAVGIHFGRARGPFVEAVANGMALYASAVAAGIGLMTWRSPRARTAAGIVLAMSCIGLLFTLTRSIWLGSVVATGVAMLATPELRRWILPAGAVGALLIVGALTFVPGLSDQASERQSDQLPVWDRLNTNRAGLRMLSEHPLIGVGWDQYKENSVDYLRQAPEYPLTGEGIDLHNVFLSHAVELGLIGFLLWAIAWVWAIGGAVISRGPPELKWWRVGLIALAVHWFIVGNFGPLGYALPTLLLWTWAGVVWAGRYADGGVTRPTAPAARR